MSRNNLCIVLERDYEKPFPKTCKLFRKIIDNTHDLLDKKECMNLYDIFVSFITYEEYEDSAYSVFILHMEPTKKIELELK